MAVEISRPARNLSWYIGDTSVRIASDPDLLALMDVAVQQTVSQYQSLLRRGVEQSISGHESQVEHGVELEMRRILEEFESATPKIEETATERVRARLLDVVWQEVRSAFDEVLANAQNLLVDAMHGPAMTTEPLLPSIQCWPLLADKATVEPHSDSLEEQLAALDRQGIPADDAVEEADDEVYEGMVHLKIQADCIREMVDFVRELRLRTQLRLQRLVGNHKQGVDIWLSLREPLPLRKMLLEIEGVEIESAAFEGDAPDRGRLLRLRLASLDHQDQPMYAAAAL